MDANQPGIVKALRQIPGVTVEVGHDDILVGYLGKTYWFEIKRPDCVSKRTGMIKDGEITDSEHKRYREWKGHYSFAWELQHILDEIGVKA